MRTAPRPLRDLLSGLQSRLRRPWNGTLPRWEQGAAALEALWNELAQRHALTLLCAYPIHSVSGSVRGHRAELRDLHTHHR